MRRNLSIDVMSRETPASKDGFCVIGGCDFAYLEERLFAQVSNLQDGGVQPDSKQAEPS